MALLTPDIQEPELLYLKETSPTAPLLRGFVTKGRVGDFCPKQAPVPHLIKPRSRPTRLHPNHHSPHYLLLFLGTKLKIIMNNS